MSVFDLIILILSLNVMLILGIPIIKKLVTETKKHSIIFEPEKEGKCQDNLQSLILKILAYIICNCLHYLKAFNIKFRRFYQYRIRN